MYGLRPRALESNLPCNTRASTTAHLDHAAAVLEAEILGVHRRDACEGRSARRVPGGVGHRHRLDEDIFEETAVDVPATSA